MNTEISKVVAELKALAAFSAEEASSIGWNERTEANWHEGKSNAYTDAVARIERALQQPASADVEREARELLAPLLELLSPNGDIYTRTLQNVAAALRKPQQEAEPVAKLVNRLENGGKTTTFIRPTALGMDLPVGEYPLFFQPASSQPRIDSNGGGHD